MQFSNARANLSRHVIDIKTVCRRNRALYYTLIVIGIIGILSALSVISKANDKFPSGGLIKRVSNGELNYYFFYIKLLLFPVCAAFFCWLLSFNVYAYFLNLPLLFFYVRHFASSFVAWCVTDGFFAYVAILLLWLPLLVTNFILFATLFLRIFELLEKPCGRFSFATHFACKPYNFYWRATKGVISWYLIWVSIINTVYASFFLIIFVIIF